MIFRQKINSQLCDTCVSGADPFTHKYDVVIAGCGTAATISALVLAEQHFKILVIERLPNLGGTLTNSVHGYYYGSTGGFYETLDTEIAAWGQPVPHVAPIGRLGHPDIRKHIYEKHLLDQGCTLAFQAAVSGVYLDGNLIRGVQYLDAQDNFVSVGCRIAIDGTAESTLCELAGCALSLGRDADMSCQPFTNCVLHDHAEAGHLGTTNIDAGYIRQNQVEDYSYQVITSLINHQDLPPQYTDQDVLVRISPLPGIREGKRIVGRQTIRFDDVIDESQPDNVLFYAYSNFDNHTKDIAFENDRQNDWIVGMNLWGAGVSVGVPAGAFLPEKIEGLLVAGRHLSVDHICAAHTRMMRDMQKLGEAVGRTAQYALENSCNPSDADFTAIRAELAKTGCFDPDNDTGVVDIINAGSTVNAVPYPRTLEAIQTLLRSDRPGFGMLAVLRRKSAGDNTIAEKVVEWFRQTESGSEAAEPCSAATKGEADHQRFNCACLLALVDNDLGAGVLLEAARTRDRRRLRTSRKYNHDYGMTAVYLLGRLGCPAAIPILMDMVRERGQLLHTDIVFDEFINSPADYQFQYISHALRALGTIAQKNPQARTLVSTLFRELLADPDFHLQATLKASRQLFDMTQRTRDYCRYILSW